MRVFFYTTLMLLTLAMWSYARRRRSVQVWKRTIPADAVRRASAVLLSRHQAGQDALGHEHRCPQSRPSHRDQPVPVGIHALVCQGRTT